MKWKLGFSAFIIFSVLTIGGLFYIWLTNPNDENVRKEFLAKNPTVKVISLGVGEGDSDNAIYHIKYKKQNDERICEYIALYQRDENGEWKTSNNLKAP